MKITLRVISLLVNCFPICCYQLPFVKAANSFSFRRFNRATNTRFHSEGENHFWSLLSPLEIHVRKYARPRLPREIFHASRENCGGVCLEICEKIAIRKSRAKKLLHGQGSFVLERGVSLYEMEFDKISGLSVSSRTKKKKKFGPLVSPKEGNKKLGRYFLRSLLDRFRCLVAIDSNTQIMSSNARSSTFKLGSDIGELLFARRSRWYTAREVANKSIGSRINILVRRYRFISSQQLSLLPMVINILNVR